MVVVLYVLLKENVNTENQQLDMVLLHEEEKIKIKKHMV